jgi:Zn finger protein HypA/HybF involved in hydrogenase expression
LASLTSGFQLFEYFPYWFRIILLFFIVDAIFSLPITLFVDGSLNDEAARKIAESKIEARNKMRINCVVCNNEIKPPGEWLSGEADLYCPVCHALMTLVLEDGKFKKLTLKLKKM